MTLETMVIFSVALSVAAMLPGPGIFAMVARALGSGFWPAVPMAVGMILGDLIFLALVVLGLAAVAHQLGGFFIVMKFMGATYLIYLGCRMWTAPVDDETIAGTKASRPAKMGLAGLLVTLSNPKTVLFFLALVPTVIDIRAIDGASFVQLSVIVVVVDAAVLGIYLRCCRSTDTASVLLVTVTEATEPLFGGSHDWCRWRCRWQLTSGGAAMPSSGSSNALVQTGDEMIDVAAEFWDFESALRPKDPKRCGDDLRIGQNFHKLSLVEAVLDQRVWKGSHRQT